MPTEIVKVSSVKFCIWEVLSLAPERAPGVGVGTELEPDPELLPVKGVAVGATNLVGVGRITVAWILGIGVEVANRELLAGT